MEIAPGIHRIQCMFGGTRMVFTYLLIGDEAAMLVDTGCAHNPGQESKTYCLHVEQRLLDFIRTNDQLQLQEAINALGMGLGSWPENTNQDFSYGMLGNLNRPTRRSLLATSRNAV